MAWWGFYFSAKLLLHYWGRLGFQVAANAALLAAVVAFVRWGPRRVWARRLTAVALAAAAAGLLWSESYFPPLGMVAGFLSDASTRPSASYIVSFLLGYWDTVVAATLLALGVACAWADRRGWRMEFLVAMLMLPAGLSALRERNLNRPDAPREERFYAEEKKRIVSFAKPRAQEKPFDIVLVQVCSLSWDDLRSVGMADDPFFSDFDLLLTRFNTVTSYSNPAALRLLRSACGQVSHADLYSAAAPQCYLLDALRAAGYRVDTVFNHDGKYSGMAEAVASLGHAPRPLALGTLPVAELNFDGGPIYSDYAALAAWWKIRQASASPRAALFYNTLSLHDGAHAVSDKNWWGRSRKERYQEFAHRLFSDLRRFNALVESSGRDALIVFVPEHGGAVRGTRLQVSGLRDIPLPSITTVPVGLRFVSRGRGAPSRRRFDGPVSYFALASLLSGAVRQTPNSRDPFSSATVAALPHTRFMSENQFARVLETSEGFLIQGKDKSWSRLAPDLAPTVLVAQGKPR